MGVVHALTRRACLALAVAAAGLAAAPGAGAASYAKGLDVSHWNGSVDWIQVVGGGYTFLFAKATEGTTLTDPTYAINRAGTNGIGMRFGAYHFARPGGSGDSGIAANAIAQADYFVGVAQPAAGDLPPVLDLETKGTLAMAGLQKWTQAWLGEVYARTGVQGLIYASPSFWKTALGDTTSFAAAGNRLWIAHWTKNAKPTVPASNWAGTGWTFWQWTDCSKIPGFVHCSDGDRMNGTNPATMAIKSFPTGAPAVATAPTVVGTAKAGTVLAGVPGTWSGGKPVSFTYQWQRCDATGASCVPILGATLETYKPVTADVGHTLVLSVTASTAKGVASAPSAPTLAIAPAGSGSASRPAVLTSPQVVGTPTAGQVLTASPGTWSGAPTSYTYEWRRCDSTGASCVAIPNATTSTYTLTPDDIGTTLSLVVTATGKGGATSVTAPTTTAISPAPIPAAVVGTLVAPQGGAGAVVTDDGRATVTWQPGAVPAGASVSLAAATQTLAVPDTPVALTVATSLVSFPWPIDLAYASAPLHQVVGYSSDGRIWTPVPPVTGTTLPVGMRLGAYDDGTAQHVLTEIPGSFALFVPGAWGDPSLVSARAPVLTRLAKAHATRQPGKVVLVTARLSVDSQTQLYANAYGPGARPSILPKGSILATPLKGAATKTARAELLKPGTINIRLRLTGKQLPPGSTGRIVVTAIDPWGRKASFGLGFKAP